MELFTATDDKGRKIECFLERVIVVDAVVYTLLTPIDTPVVLVRIGESDEEDQMIEDFESAGEVLAVADACLAEHSLTLVRSAVTLTVSGKLLPAEIEEIEDDDTDQLEEGEDLFELLISFRHNGQEYGLYIPFEHFFIVARVTGDDKGVIVVEAEFERIQSIIEAEWGRHEKCIWVRTTTQPVKPQSPQDIVWFKRQKRILEAIADHAPFSIRKDLTISALLSLALESLPECPETTKQAWLKDAVDSCLRGINRTVLKEVSWPNAVEAPRRLPVPIALADGREPGSSDASAYGCVHAGVIDALNPSHWRWHFTHYLLLESNGFTHWLPFDVECLPVRVEP